MSYWSEINFFICMVFLPVFDEKMWKKSGWYLQEKVCVCVRGVCLWSVRIFVHVYTCGQMNVNNVLQESEQVFPRWLLSYCCPLQVSCCSIVLCKHFKVLHRFAAILFKLKVKGVIDF